MRCMGFRQLVLGKPTRRRPSRNRNDLARRATQTAPTTPRCAALTLAPFRKSLTTYNGLTSRISGTPRSSWGLLTYIGRHSGRRYQTSLGTTAFGDGLLLPLGYGTDSDWYRNITATGRCELQAWPTDDRILLRLAGVHDFVWVHGSEGPEANTHASAVTP